MPCVDVLLHLILQPCQRKIFRMQCVCVCVLLYTIITPLFVLHGMALVYVFEYTCAICGVVGYSQSVAHCTAGEILRQCGLIRSNTPTFS